MKAIYKDKVYHVVDDLGAGLLLEPIDGPGSIQVQFGNPDLIPDPTDGELAVVGYFTDDHKDTQRIKNEVDWRKLGKMPPPLTEPTLPTYPVRPRNGGPLEQALDAGLCTGLNVDKLWAFEPKINGWRAIVHTPTGSMWNRHGTRSSGFTATPLLPAIEQLKTCPFEWLDVELLSRRHNIAQGSVIVLDWIVAHATYDDRQRLLAAIFQRLELGEETDNVPVRLITPARLGTDTVASLRMHWHQLQEVNTLLGCTFYEGIVAKRRASQYPMQLRSPDEVTTDWVKHKFTTK